MTRKQLLQRLRMSAYQDSQRDICDCAGAHDRATLIAMAIAELLHPEAEFRQPGMSAPDYVELARRAYATEYLAPLLAAAQVPEVPKLPCPNYLCHAFDVCLTACCTCMDFVVCCILA